MSNLLPFFDQNTIEYPCSLIFILDFFRVVFLSFLCDVSFSVCWGQLSTPSCFKFCVNGRDLEIVVLSHFAIFTPRRRPLLSQHHHHHHHQLVKAAKKNFPCLVYF